MHSRSKQPTWIAAGASLLALVVATASPVTRAADNPLGLKPHHVTASVTDIDRAVKWYQDVLGFKVVNRGSRGDSVVFKFAELEIPGYGLGLVQSDLPAVSVPVGTRVRPSWEHVVFSVSDPDATYRSFKKRGLDVFVHAPTDAPPLSSFLIHDSEGNEIEFVKAEEMQLNASHQGHDSALTESNRAIVDKFVDLFYRQRNVRLAFETYVGEPYIQHNPNIPDGREAAIRALEPMFSNPAARFDVKRVLVDGDLAAVHLHGRTSDQAAGGAVVDMFRLEHGKIVEHWDVLQPVPAQAANAHPMF